MLQRSESLSEQLRGCQSFVLLAETAPAACSIKQRWAGRCEHLTLPSSLMGTHCVLTFKFPRCVPPCLFRCFPPSCYLAVRGQDLTADLKRRSGTGVLFNDFPPLLSPFCNQVRLNMFCLSPVILSLPASV